MGKKSRTVEYAEYITVKSFIATASFLPSSFTYILMNGVSSILYRMLKRRRLITIDNLEKAFPNIGSDGAEKMAREVYHELSVTVSDILLMAGGRLRIDEMVENYDEALETLDNLKKKHKNGIIFMGAHFSNWELPPLFASKHGFPMTVIGRKGDNELIDKNIVLPFRSRYGNHTVYKKKAGIAMLRTLKQGGTVGVLIDQKVNKENGFLVPFFGRDAFTTHAVATLKLKADPAVIPISMPRISRGKYRLNIGDAIEYKAEEVDDERQKLYEMTKKYNEALEAIVRENPNQWFWVHDRWNKRV